MLDRLFSSCLGNLSLQQDVKPTHVALSRDVHDPGLSFELENNDFRAYREVCLNKGIQHNPYHLRLGSFEGRTNLFSDCRFSPVGSNGILAMDLRSSVCRNMDAIIIFGNADGPFAVPYKWTCLSKKQFLYYRLSDDEKILMQSMLKLNPPFILARLELPICES